MTPRRCCDPRAGSVSTSLSERSRCEPARASWRTSGHVSWLGSPAKRPLFIELRQSKYLNNIVEHDHRATILAGIETMHMIKKGQLDCPKVKALSAASQFYWLAF